MDLVEIVLAILKPLASKLGFNKSELKSAAANIADNLSLEENASEDDAKEAAQEAVEKALPFLKLSQTAYSRMVKAYKQSQVTDDDDDDAQDDDDKKNKKDKKQTKNDDDDIPPYFKKMMEEIGSLKTEITSLKQGKVVDTRRSLLEEIVKDTGSFGKMALKNFDKMSFEDDDDFNEYCEEVKSELKTLNQERANLGLEQLGTPQKVEKKDETKPEPITDEQMDKIAGLY